MAHPADLRPAVPQFIYLCDGSSCEKPASQRCSRCKKVRYCSLECQQGSWETHKTYCDRTPSWPPPRKTGPIPALWLTDQGEQGELVQLTQEIFQRKTGVLFSPRAVCSPATYKTVENYSDSSEASPEMVQRLIEKPPAVALTEHPNLRNSLISLERIPSGSLICSFGGEVNLDTPNTYRNQGYGIAGLDQTLYASLGGFVNDGPPNSFFARGQYGQTYIRAMRDIEKGEMICTNYSGLHHIKAGNYFISDKGYRDVVDFVHSPPFASLQFFSDPKDAYPRTMWFYIAGTLPVLTRLILENHLTTTEVRKRLDFAKELHTTYPPLRYLPYYPEMFSALDKILAAGKNLKERIIRLSDRIKIHSFVMSLSSISAEPGLPIEEAIGQVETLGALYDDLYVLVQGAEQGTYLKVDDPFPSVIINTPAFLAKFETLPYSQQLEFIKVLLTGFEQLEKKKAKSAIDNLEVLFIQLLPIAAEKIPVEEMATLTRMFQQLPKK